jgi:GT2 family glycosyltransferase
MEQQFYRNGRWQTVQQLRRNRLVTTKDICPYCDKNTEHEKCKGDLISIVIPSRVGEKIESLDSIEGQTYKNYEVIVQYDEKKQGAAATRNKGALKAKGKYIFFCDNDVNLSPDCLEVLWKTIKKEKVQVVCARVEIDGNPTPKKSNLIPQVKKSVAYAQHFYGVSTMALIDAKVKPKFDPKMLRYDDWDLWMTLDKQGHKFHFLEKVILSTKNRPTGISSQDNNQEWKEKLYTKHGIKEKLADIIIPHHNRHDHLHRCLDGIDNSIFNIIVRSGGTFSHNCNEGAKAAETDTLIFLNDDVDTDNELLIQIACSEGDMVGTSQYIGDTKYYGIGWRPSSEGAHEGWTLSLKPEDSFVPSGYLMKFTRKAWEELGGLDEAYRNGAEDLDIGLRAIQKGMSVNFVDFPMNHKHSQSAGRYDFAGYNNEIFNKSWTTNQISKLKK